MTPQVTFAGCPVCDCGGLLISPNEDVGKKWGMSPKMAKALSIARKYDVEYACSSCLKPAEGKA